MRAKRHFELDAGRRLALSGTLGWRHNLSDTTPQRHLAFASGSQPFSVESVALSRDAALLGSRRQPRGESRSERAAGLHTACWAAARRTMASDWPSTGVSDFGYEGMPAVGWVPAGGKGKKPLHCPSVTKPLQI
ncbi:autotransporter domain-containing protein [Pseudomonas aeruginosa]|nr:autotransporter domain-containing protein [Pseudomonas aeruginosa]